MFSIAETIGGCTVDELSERMSVSERREWQEYFKIKEEEREKKRKQRKNKRKRNKGRRRTRR